MPLQPRSSSLGTGDTFSLELHADCYMIDDVDVDEPFGKPLVPLRAGDLDGRGTNDLAFGFPEDKVQLGSWVSVFFGEDFECDGRLWTDYAEVRLHASDDMLAGSQLASGDVDGDGRSELLVGAEAHNEYGPRSGAVFLFDEGALRRGTWELETVATARILGGSEGAGLSEGGIVARDLDGDGLADVATDGDLPRNAVYLFDGGDLPARASLTEADASASIVGSAKGGIARRPREGGDANGDGYEDLLVRIVGDSVDGVALWHGQSPLLAGTLTATDADVLFVGGPATEGTAGTLEVGTEFDGTGDMDGDGMGDVVVNGTLDSDEGRSWFFDGSSIPASGTASVSDADANFAVPSDAATSIRLWGGIAGGRDVNGDDIPDLLIGDPERDAAYLVYGW